MFKRNTILLLTIFTSLFIHNQVKSQTANVTKGNRAVLDQHKGYGVFIFGKKISDFKGFKSVPAPEEVIEMYFSNSPVKLTHFKADSIQLKFFGKKLYAFELFVNKSEVTKAISQFTTAYSSYSKLPALEGIYHWKGKSVTLDISSIDDENKAYSIRFEDLKTRARMEAAVAKKGDDLSWLTEETKKN